MSEKNGEGQIMNGKYNPAGRTIKKINKKTDMMKRTKIYIVTHIQEDGGNRMNLLN